MSLETVFRLNNQSIALRSARSQLGPVPIGSHSQLPASFLRIQQIPSQRALSFTDIPTTSVALVVPPPVFLPVRFAYVSLQTLP